MTTELEIQLREALHEDAQHARLVNPDQPPLPEVVLMPDTPRRAHSTRRLVALAAAIALLVTAGVVLVRTSDHRKADVNVTPSPTTLPTVTIPPGPARLFSNLPAGATLPLPAAPISERLDNGAVVWTG